MAYTTRPAFYLKTYVPSDDVITEIANCSSTAQTTYTLMAYFTLIGGIGKESKFRFKFKLFRGADGTAYGRIYRNGVAVGTERSTTLASPGEEFTEDINTTDWRTGDTVQLYLKRGTSNAGATNFQICGAGSEWLTSA